MVGTLLKQPLDECSAKHLELKELLEELTAKALLPLPTDLLIVPTVQKLVLLQAGPAPQDAAFVP